MDERETLLQQAKDMGLKPHHSTGAEKLKAMIAEAKSAADEGTKGGDTSPPSSPAKGELIEARVLDSLKHNGKLYGPDTDRPTVELTLKEFETLEGFKVVERLPEG